MSIFSAIFGGGNNNSNPAPAPAPVQSQPGNIPPQAGQTNPTNPTVPAGQPAPANNPAPSPAEPVNPMDAFASLWAPTPVDPNNPGPQPLINVDPKAIAEAAKKTDFSKMISQENLTAISQGGEAAMQAFAQAMNSVAQGVYAQSSFASTKIVEQAVAKAKEQFLSEIPSHVKKLQVSENLRSENPALSHPAAAPIIGALETMFTQKHPNASSAEITKLAKEYLETFAGAVNGPRDQAAQAAQAKQANQGVMDWTNYLNPNPN